MAFVVSDEKSSVNLWVSVVHDEYFPSYSFQNFIFVFQHFYYDMSSCGLTWIYPTWSFLSFLYVQINIFHQILEGFLCLLNKLVLFSLTYFTGILFRLMLLYLIVYHISLRFYSFFILFLYYVPKVAYLFKVCFWII